MLTDGDSRRADFTSSNRQTYDRIARSYADTRRQQPWGEDHWLFSMETDFVASLPGEGLVADLGCGPADDGLRLTDRGLRVVGMDLSAGMLAIAAHRLNGHVVQADLRALPIDSQRLDGIWNMASLLRVPERDTPTVLGEFRRVMRPSGSLVLVTALGDSDRHEPVPYASDESRWFVYRDPVVLKAQMSEAGFLVRSEVVRQSTRHWWAALASLI